MGLLEATIERTSSGEDPAHPLLRCVDHGMSVGNFAARAGVARTQALCALNAMRHAGHVRITLPCPHPDLRTVAQGGEPARQLCARRPGLWNAYAYEREWESHPEYNAFMHPDAPVHGRKMFQAEIYERLLAPWLETPGAGNRVLDAGAGVGRMVPLLARTHARMDLTDASERALLHAWDALCAARAQHFDLHWRDAGDLGCFEDNTFDLCMALELLCYVDDPPQAAAELARVCRPGGVVAFSVENKAGAIFGDPHIEAADIDVLLKCNELIVPEYLCVKYHTADGAAALAGMAGLRVLLVAGCHFLADGPFDALVSEELFTDPRRRARALAAEDICREHPFLRRLGRAWLVVAQKPLAATRRRGAPPGCCL